MSGISDAGESAEAWFCRITGALRTPKGSTGDAILEGVTVEVKDASGGTINQARPIRAMPIVVWSSGVWYVVPALKAVTLALRRKRGQHTENALECLAIRLAEVEDCVCAESDLRQRVLSSATDERLANALRACLEEMRAQVDRQWYRLGTLLELEKQARLFAPAELP